MAIVEDQAELREGLGFLIHNTDGYRCYHRYGSVEEAVAVIGNDPPDIALVDIGLPGMSGIEGVRVLKSRFPGMMILMLTVYKDDERIFQAICAGATGYLLKKTPPARLLESVREAVAGGAPMSPEVARRVVELFRAYRPPEQSDQRLTSQEHRLLDFLGEGHHYKTAAEQMGISIHTVKFYMRSIYGKLQVHSKSEAVAKGLRLHLIR